MSRSSSFHRNSSPMIPKTSSLYQLAMAGTTEPASPAPKAVRTTSIMGTSGSSRVRDGTSPAPLSVRSATSAHSLPATLSFSNGKGTPVPSSGKRHVSYSEAASPAVSRPGSALSTDWLHQTVLAALGAGHEYSPDPEALVTRDARGDERGGEGGDSDDDRSSTRSNLGDAFRSFVSSRASSRASSKRGGSMRGGGGGGGGGGDGKRLSESIFDVETPRTATPERHDREEFIGGADGLRTPVTGQSPRGRATEIRETAERTRRRRPRGEGQGETKDGGAASAANGHGARPHDMPPPLVLTPSHGTMSNTETAEAVARSIIRSSTMSRSKMNSSRNSVDGPVDTGTPTAAAMLEASRMLIKHAFQEQSTAVYTTYDDLYEPFVAEHEFLLAKRTKVAICVTMFNEAELELRRTMEGIAANMAQFRVHHDEIVMCVVVDGRVNLPAETLAYMNKIKLIDSGALADEGHRAELGVTKTAVHVFENPGLRVHKNTPDDEVIQSVTVFKEKNAGKLSSHRWFFEGLCRRIEPDVVMLIDAGTQPKAGALEALRLEFDENPDVGGTCGELRVFQPRCFQIVNSSQQFEYKLSHIMDKAMESMFGFVTVLPGAFSAYRYRAVVGRPLEQYFHTELAKESDDGPTYLSPFVSNMYLAEDRILGFEVLARDDEKWVLSFVSESVADTDVPGRLVDLVKQRRRWLNGAFFTSLYFILNWPRLMTHASHSVWRKMLLLIQVLYMVANVVLNWLTLGNMYLAFYIVLSITVREWWAAAFDVLLLGYAGLTFLQFVYALGTKATDFPSVYTFFSSLHGVAMLGTIGALVWYLIQTASLEILFLVGAAGVGSYALVTVVYGEVFFVLVSALQYLAMVPTFMNVIMIFSFCNAHDVSWGTREAKRLADKHLDDEAVARALKAAEEQETIMRRARCYLVSAWIVTNWAFLSAWVTLEETRLYATCVVIAYGGMLGFRLTGSLLYRARTLFRRCRRCCSPPPARSTRVSTASHKSVLGKSEHTVVTVRASPP